MSLPIPMLPTPKPETPESTMSPHELAEMFNFFRNEETAPDSMEIMDIVLWLRVRDETLSLLAKGDYLEESDLLLIIEPLLVHVDERTILDTILEAAVMHPNCPVSVLVKATHSVNKDLRHAAAMNPVTPDEDQVYAALNEPSTS